MFEWLEAKSSDIWDLFTLLYTTKPWLLVIALLVLVIVAFVLTVLSLTIVIGLPVGLIVGLLCGIVTFIKLSVTDDWYQEELRAEAEAKAALEEQPDIDDGSPVETLAPTPVVEDVQLPEWMVRKNGKLL